MSNYTLGIYRVESWANKSPGGCANSPGAWSKTTRRSPPVSDRNPPRPRLYDNGEIEEAEVGTLLPPVYDVPPSEWTSHPRKVGDLIGGVLDGLEDDAKNAGRSVDYHEYLKSEKWAVVRRIIRRRAQNKCEFCGETRQMLNVHHLTYARLGSEELYDLVCLCRDCHRREHNIRTSDHPYSEAN